jgi:aminoglycoside phosphotransferase (APT) family kinase protein
LIHGDFFASNIIIDSSSPAVRICPVDWELAAIGPRLLDLASLVAGNWTETQRRELAMAYFTEATPTRDMSNDAGAVWTNLQFCRLHLAVQMLGWSATWRAGPAHAYDWLGEAIRLADDLGIG